MDNYFRTIVSGKRNRYEKDGYNLDLTYITDRVVAMSFPAHTFKEKRFRNDIDKVAEFFDQRHPKEYFVYNMSNREMQTRTFHDMVISYPWEDHHSPALSVLFESCEHMF